MQLAWIPWIPWLHPYSFLLTKIKKHIKGLISLKSYTKNAWKWQRMQLRCSSGKLCQPLSELKEKKNLILQVWGCLCPLDRINSIPCVWKCRVQTAFLCVLPPLVTSSNTAHYWDHLRSEFRVFWENTRGLSLRSQPLDLLMVVTVT